MNKVFHKSWKEKQAELYAVSKRFRDGRTYFYHYKILKEMNRC